MIDSVTSHGRGDHPCGHAIRASGNAAGMAAGTQPTVVYGAGWRRSDATAAARAAGPLMPNFR